MCKLSWLANPGVESLAVRFPSEDTMNVWRDTLLARKMACKEDQRKVEMTRRVQSERLRARGSSEFNYLTEQGDLENPYKDKDSEFAGLAGRFGSKESLTQGEALVSLTQGEALGSGNSFRSLSGEGGFPTKGRAPPMKYPAAFAGTPLTLRTQQLHSAGPGPMDVGANSFFSPSLESPMSARTSASSGIGPFIRQSTSTANNWPTEDSARFTAPTPMTRPSQNGYGAIDSSRNGRMPVHPSSLAQTRSRSASSPDVQGRLPTLANAPPLPLMPSHLGNQPPIGRMQGNAPNYANGRVASGSSMSPVSKLKSGSQSRDFTSGEGSPEYDTYYSQNNRTSAQTQSSGAFSPPLLRGSVSSEGAAILSFKIKVYVPSEGTTFVLIAGSHITYRNLRDRIDAKLARCSSMAVGLGSLRLQFKDDGEMISIQTDEDVQTAFDLWRESHMHRDSVISSQSGEIEIFCTKA